MFRVVENTVFRVIVIITQKRQIRPRRRVAGQILDRAVHRRHPPILVRGKAIRIVQVHLDQILIVAVGAARPSAVAVDEAAIRNTHIAAQQPRERLAQGRVERVDQIGLALLRQLAVGRVAGQVGQARPLHDQSADGGDAIGRGICQPWGVEVDAVVGDARGRVEGELEVIAQALGFGEHGGGFGGVVAEFGGLGACEEIIGFDAHSLVLKCSEIYYQGS